EDLRLILLFRFELLRVEPVYLRRGVDLDLRDLRLELLDLHHRAETFRLRFVRFRRRRRFAFRRARLIRLRFRALDSPLEDCDLFIRVGRDRRAPLIVILRQGELALRIEFFLDLLLLLGIGAMDRELVLELPLQERERRFFRRVRFPDEPGDFGRLRFLFRPQPREARFFPPRLFLRRGKEVRRVYFHRIGQGFIHRLLTLDLVRDDVRVFLFT